MRHVFGGCAMLAEFCVVHYFTCCAGGDGGICVSVIESGDYITLRCSLA